MADDGIAAYFQYRRNNKNEPGSEVHAAVARAGSRCGMSSSSLTNCSL
jgi:hypothetical protein